MIYINILFEMLSSMTETIDKQPFFQKKNKLLLGQLGNLDQIAPDLCNCITHNLYLSTTGR